MAITKTDKTLRFLGWWAHIPWIVFSLLVLTFFFGGSFERLLMSRTIAVEPEEVEDLETLKLTPSQWGALQVNVTAEVPDNHWVTYEMQLRDAKGQVVASALKEAWAESGTWFEEGESGSWAERDLAAGLDVRSRQPEQLTLSLAVLDYTNTAGQAIEQPVPLRVTVRSGVVDFRYLWPGLIGTGVLAWLMGPALKRTGRTVLVKKRNDSDVSGRAIIGGDRDLIRVEVTARLDEDHPTSYVRLSLSVRDAEGQTCYRYNGPVDCSIQKTSEGEVTAVTAKWTGLMVLKSRSTYGFYVTIEPEQLVDSVTLVVVEGAKTFGAAEVTTIQVLA